MTEDELSTYTDIDQLCQDLLAQKFDLGYIDAEIARDIRNFIPDMRAWWHKYNELLSFNEIFIRRTADVGVIPAEKAIEYGLTGPCLRGSGVQWDLRKNEPYCLYDTLDFDIPVGEGKFGTIGDSWDRYWVRMCEIWESLKIIEQAIEGLPEGPVQAKVPRVLKIPAGELYFRAENPRGELGFYIVGDGDDRAYRARCRPPSVLHFAMFPHLIRCHTLSDVVAVLGSLNIIAAELDR